MLLKFNAKRKSDPITYLMGAKTFTGQWRSEPPQVIRGSISNLRRELRTIHRNQKATQVIASYHPDDRPTVPEIVLDMDLLTRVVFPGCRDEDHEEVFVLHRQNKPSLKCVRVDVHGIWLRQHMSTGLAFNPYFHPSDVHRFNLFKRIINLARGYQEPEALEHSRVFGETLKGTLNNELELVIRRIFLECSITSRIELADELDRRGYVVKRRRSGEPRGRKSFTVTMPDGTEIKQKGGPLHAMKAKVLTAPAVEFRQQLKSMLEELNALCLKRAERNWRRYQCKVEALSFDEAKHKGFGFDPITFQLLFPTIEYENKRQQRIGLSPPRGAGTNKVTEPSHPSTASRSGNEDLENRETIGDNGTEHSELNVSNPSPLPSIKSIHESTHSGSGAKLAESIVQVTSAVGGLIKGLVKQAKATLTQAPKSRKQ